MKTIFYKSILCMILFVTLFFLYEPQETNDKTYQGKEKDVYVNVEMNQATHQVLLDDYLLGVVAGEMPASFEIEAIKAQVDYEAQQRCLSSFYVAFAIVITLGSYSLGTIILGNHEL